MRILSENLKVRILSMIYNKYTDFTLKFYFLQKYFKLGSLENSNADDDDNNNDDIGS